MYHHLLINMVDSEKDMSDFRYPLKKMLTKTESEANTTTEREENTIEKEENNTV